MDDAKSGFQVVEVLGECRLRDAQGRKHMYWRRDGCSLTPGFYVVHWPPGAVIGRFHEDAKFEGPFRERSGAEAGMQRLKAYADAGEPCRPLDVASDGNHLTLHRRPT